MNNDDIVQEQKAMCRKYGSDFVASDFDLKIGVALETLKSEPITGLRSELRGDTAGWYIWGGEFSDAPDFFQSLCVHHLDVICAGAMKYLGLAPGFGFIFDHRGYEDVWNDPERLERERKTE